MAPGILTDVAVHSGNPQSQAYPKPLKQSGSLDKFSHEDTTPVIGREFLQVNIVDDILNAPNADDLLRDLAITSKHLASKSFNCIGREQD
jgi:hypothetical protein